MADPSGRSGPDAPAGDRPAIVAVHLLSAVGHARRSPGTWPAFAACSQTQRSVNSAASYGPPSSTCSQIRSAASIPMSCCGSAARRTSRTAPTSSAPVSTTATAAVWPMRSTRRRRALRLRSEPPVGEGHLPGDPAGLRQLLQQQRFSGATAPRRQRGPGRHGRGGSPLVPRRDRVGQRRGHL